ncbi:protoporphyrinogen oxidase [Candidatus Poribacteria bacterium]|nr:protoporphyrinogen oxidase [Candidatus Poribacteria bacterium]
MTDEPRPYDCVVIGGGVSGLTAAYRLAKRGCRTLLAERAEHCGGVITTEHRDGFILEKGPNSFSSVPGAIMEMLEEIGLRERAMLLPMKEHDRFIWYRGALRLVPISPGGLFTTDILTLGEKWRAVRGVFQKFPPPEGDVTLGAFFRERVGDAVVERMLKPFMAGVYAADADRVSFEATLGKFFRAVQQHPSIVKAGKSLRKPGEPRPRRCLVSFPDGLREFPAAMTAALEKAGGAIRTHVRAVLRPGGGEPWTLDLHSGTDSVETIEARALIVAASSDAAAELLRSAAPGAADAFDAVPYAALRVIHVGLREDQLTESRNGFGFLSVAGQGIRMLGMIWSDRLYRNRAPEGHRLLTCFYGGEKDPEVNDWPDELLTRQLATDLKTVMGFKGGDFRLLQVTSWKRALPVFHLGHMTRMGAALKQLPPGIEMMGNYLGGVSIPDRVAQARELAETVAGRLARSPQQGKVPA